MLLRAQIQADLAHFTSQSFDFAALDFWKTLGYRSELTLEDLPTDFDGLQAELGISWRADRVFAPQWNGAHFLFQLQSEQIAAQNSLFKAAVELQAEKSYLFFGLDLAPRPEKLPWNRSQLAQIARELNRPFQSPILLLVRHDARLTLAVVDRRASQRDAGQEVLEKVTLVRDIDLENPQRGHLDILTRLFLPSLAARNWDELHRAWKAVLDLQELNRKFFRELSDWYFYARHQVVFPQPTSEVSPQTHASLSVIRLLTRLMFAYFLRERDLVPPAVFEATALQKLLKDSSPGASSYYKAVLQNLFFATPIRTTFWALATVLATGRPKKARRNSSRRIWASATSNCSNCATKPPI